MHEKCMEFGLWYTCFGYVVLDIEHDGYSVKLDGYGYLVSGKCDYGYLANWIMGMGSYGCYMDLKLVIG